MKKISKLLATISLIFSILSLTCATVIGKLDATYFSNLDSAQVVSSYYRVFTFNRFILILMYVFIILALISIIVVSILETNKKNNVK
jgi:hypothetical protein